MPSFSGGSGSIPALAASMRGTSNALTTATRRPLLSR